MRELRRFIIWSTGFQPFSVVYRSLYHLAVRLFSQWTRLQPEVSCLLVRGSYSRNDFKPGLSDIDFLLLIKSDLGSTRTHRFVNFFRRRFALIKRFIPFLGEVEILGQEHFLCWQYYACDRFDLVTVVGETPTCLPPLEDEELLLKALTDFMYFLLPNAESWFASEVGRLCQKIHRCLRCTAPDLTSERWIQVAEVLLALNRSCEGCPLNDGEPGGRSEKVESVELPSELTRWTDEILQVVIPPYAPNDYLVVVRAEIRTDKLGALIKRLCETRERPRIFTPLTLQRFLTTVSFVEGQSLARHRQTWGPLDLLENLVWDKEATERAVLVNSAFILAYVTSQSHPVGSLSNLLIWFLRNLLFLETTKIVLDEDEVIELSEHRHADLNEKRLRAVAQGTEEAHFELYRTIAHYLSDQMKRRMNC
jgi:predicted nucleotidyltransferase